MSLFALVMGITLCLVAALKLIERRATEAVTRAE
jgi:hypothetical protein